MTAAPRRAGPLLGSFLFLVFAPGIVAGYMPYTMTHWRFEPPFFGIVWLRAVGAAVVFGGVVILIDSFLRFALEGRGTPAPVVPPKELVVSGMYRFVRNPMYVAVLSIIFGQTLLFGSTTLLVYAIALWVAFQSFVMLYEEPTLRMQFGQSYDVYCANVSRWLPRLRPWSLDQRTIDPLMSSHVPQHQDSRELRASGDRNRNPRVGAAIRPQIERDE